MARLTGYSTIIYDTDERCEVMQTVVRTLQRKRVNGIVLAPCGDSFEIGAKNAGLLQMWLGPEPNLDVINHYNSRFNLHLTPDEIRDLLAFLRSL